MKVRIIQDGQEVHRAVSAMAEVAIELKEKDPRAAAMALHIAKAWWEDLKREGQR